MKKYFLILITIFSIGIGASAQTKSNVISNLSTERFKAIIANDKGGMIIDLRTIDEISKGYIKGAVQIDYLAKDFDAKMSKLDKTKTYYIYCQSGGRSADAADYMEKQGFKKVYTLEKGFSDWKAKEFPVEQK